MGRGGSRVPGPGAAQGRAGLRAEGGAGEGLGEGAGPRGGTGRGPRAQGEGLGRARHSRAGRCDAPRVRDVPPCRPPSDPGCLPGLRMGGSGDVAPLLRDSSPGTAGVI